MEQKELQYRGYRGSVEYSVEDGVFHGKLTGIRDLVSYEGDAQQISRNLLTNSAKWCIMTVDQVTRIWK